MGSIWIATKGFGHQSGSRAVFYAESREELVKFISDRGFAETLWSALFENSDGEWIRLDELQPIQVVK